MSANLTKRQLELLNFIKKFIAENQIAPSYREIMKHFGFASLASVYRYVHTLKKKGIIDFEENEARSLKLNTSTNTFLNIPYIGYIKGEFPFETFTKTDTIPLPSSWISKPDETYILRVKGDTFLEESILPGDFLVIEARQEIKEGEMSLLLINSTDLLLKRYYDESPFIRLEGTNPKLKPLRVRYENLQIQGVLIALFRNL